MASRRSLGGGRVLGSGRNISPVPPSTPSPAPPQGAVHRRNASLLAPSESSVSLNSQTSASPASTIDTSQDINSKVTLAAPDHSNAAPATSRLVCPICNDEMMTLLQLNRHLDDLHQDIDQGEQNEVKNWFETQMVKAKKFQPLAVLNQKLKGLDVFESNDTPPPPSHRPSRSTGQIAMPESAARPDPDEAVTRAHWQRSASNNEECTEPSCHRRLGSIDGKVNCRKCGKLFCEEHTMYQMKLSRSAQHEPVRGFWCRVCETCYVSREGYNDHHGFERNHTEAFRTMRRAKVDKAYLETSRLEKRLTKLTHLLANPPPPEQVSGNLSNRWSIGSLTALTNAKAQQRRQIEQSIIDWEDDATVSNCPFCQQEFSSYTFRRHHCRLCGRVVCSDPQTACSTEVGLAVAALTDNGTEKSIDQMMVDVRMCQTCKHTLFSKSDFARELSQQTPDQRAYENLAQFERGIRLMLPRFEKLLRALQDESKPPSPAELQDASKVRKRLMDAFAQFDVAARRIRDMPTDSPTQQKLQKAVYQQAYNFLSTHMLPLKRLPKILKHAAPNGVPSRLTSSGRTHSALANIKYNDIEMNSQVSSSSAVTAMEAEEKDLRERLIVLEEQKFFVSEMIADANKRRKFDEVSALSRNVEDLSTEIDQVNSQLSQLDFASAYQGIASPPAVD